MCDDRIDHVDFGYGKIPCMPSAALQARFEWGVIQQDPEVGCKATLHYESGQERLAIVSSGPLRLRNIKPGMAYPDEYEALIVSFEFLAEVEEDNEGH